MRRRLHGFAPRRHVASPPCAHAASALDALNPRPIGGRHGLRAGPEWERHFSPTRIATMAVAAILLFALAVSLVIGCFTVFHASLILANVTTKEWCKKKERSALRDDNRVHRVFYACCEPSEVTFTELVPKNLVGNYAELL